MYVDSPLYDRAKLYQEVWAEPVRVVAERYDVSDVYLARICRRLSVPLPGRGYWAKATERRPPRPPLPTLEKSELFRLRSVGVQRSPEQRRYQQAAESARSDARSPVVVDETLIDPHELVARTERRLRRAKVREGVVSGRRLGVLNVSVAPESLDRALRICDALLKALEATGLEIEVTGPVEPDRDDWGVNRNEHLDQVTRVRCREEWLTLSLWEGVSSEVDPNPKRPRRRPGDSIGYTPWQPPSYIYTPTGVLALQITNLAGTGMRGLFRETARRRLEDLLPAFIAQLGPAAEALKAKHAEEERLRLEREERERRWREAEERRWEEQRRLERLTKEAVSWREARFLRDFAEAALRQLGSAADDDEAHGARRAELEWLLDYADRIDPLSG
jgi:hypothetical protein